MNNTGDIGKKKIVSTRIINAGNDYFPRKQKSIPRKRNALCHAKGNIAYSRRDKNS